MSGGIADVVELAEGLAAEGRQIWHLEIGRPDFGSPQVAIDAASAALAEGRTHYANLRGELYLREAVARKLKRENGIDVSPEDVLITIGAQAAMMSTMAAVLDPGDEVIIPTPCYGAYPNQCKIFGMKPVYVRCDPSDGFAVKASAIEAAMTDRTRCIVLNTPNNPTGAVISRTDLEGIAELAKSHDLLVISDECYERFLYGGVHTSIASLPGMADRAVTVGSSSKTYSMTGWRLGYMASPSWLTPYAAKAHLELTTCAANFPQRGYAAALDEADDDVRAMVTEYAARREIMARYLREMPGLSFTMPEGAFYFLPSVAGTGMTATEFCTFALKEAGVATVPGEAFEAPGHVRFAYCKPQDYIRDAMESLKSAMHRAKI